MREATSVSNVKLPKHFSLEKKGFSVELCFKGGFVARFSPSTVDLEDRINRDVDAYLRRRIRR